MSYQIVRNGLVGILNGLGLSESSATNDFEDASVQEYENTFILNCQEGEASLENDQQRAFLYDNQIWNVQIAFGKSGASGANQRDSIHRKKDDLLTNLDDPENWRSFCTILRYRNWSLEERESYFVLSIQLKIKDALTY